MDHSAESITEALNLDEYFLSFMTFTILAKVIKKEIKFNTFSEMVVNYAEAIVDFWEDNPSIKKAMSAQQHTILTFLVLKHVDKFMQKVRSTEEARDLSEAAEAFAKENYNKYKNREI